MANTLFREKSLKKIASPEEMDRYIKIINPSVWVVLSAIIILLAGFIVWGIFGNVETKVSISGVVKNGHMETVILVTQPNASKLENNQLVFMNDEEIGKVANVQYESDGRVSLDIITTNLADGKYDLDILIESINLMYFIFN